MPIRQAAWAARALSIVIGCAGLPVDACADPAPAPSTEPHSLGFASPEHAALGGRVYLRFGDGSRRRADQVVLLHRAAANGYGENLSYADLLYLGGDFYSVPYAGVGHGAHVDSDAIAALGDGDAPAVALRRHLLTFSYQHYVDYLPRLRAIERDLQARFERAVRQRKPFDYATADDCRFMLATDGASCIKGIGDLLNLTRYLGLYFDISVRNRDHFHEDAQTAFLVGQKLALDAALNARDARDLRYAYQIAGFAGHYGGDAFASGHVRTDRRRIEAYCAAQFAHWGITGYAAQLLSGLLVKHMHDEDNRLGVFITGRDGTQWFGVGDDYLPTPAGQASIEHAGAALQLAVDQIYDAYAGRATLDHRSYVRSSLRRLQQQLPDIALTTADSEHNTPALFEPTATGMQWNDPERGSEPLNCYTAVWYYADAVGRAQLDGWIAAHPPRASQARRSIDVEVTRDAGVSGVLGCEWSRLDEGDVPSTDGHFTPRATAHLESSGRGARGSLYCMVMAADQREPDCTFTVAFDNPLIGRDRATLTDRAGSCRVDIDLNGRGDHWKPRLRVMH